MLYKTPPSSTFKQVFVEQRFLIYDEKRAFHSAHYQTTLFPFTQITMKKHWQIKPWVVIVSLIVLIGSILFAIGISPIGEKYSYEADYSGSSAIAAMPASDMGYNTKAMNIAYEESYQRGGDADISAQDSQERMIIKTGYVSMRVENVPTSAKTITDYAEKNGGFVVNTNIDKSDLSVDGSVTIRVPSKIFDTTIEYVKTLGEIQSQNISGQDITEQYTDLDSQLKNLKATEEQFLAIMKDAYKIEDVLAVQRELMNVRGQIEMIEGRMKYLKESVDMSSLTVYLSTDPSKLPIVDEGNQWKPIAIMKDAFRSLLGTGQGVVNGLIWLVVYIPVIAVLGILTWVVRKLWKHWRKKK